MNFNTNIIKINNKDEYFEISNLINEITNKNDYTSEKNRIKNIKTIYIIIITFFILIYLYYNLYSIDFYNIKLKKEIINIEQYFKICDKGILINNRKFNKLENPQISIVSSIYNEQNYILRFLRSIKNQNYDKIAIILIDDFSEDNSTKIIENIQNEDERIILIKHKKNKGTLISRNEGLIISKGKYILMPDSDDILSNDILNQCIIIAEENNYDIIRFNIYKGNNNIYMYNDIKYLVDKSIYQPELSSYIFYGKGNLKLIDPMISNKFVKRNIFINSLNMINNYFLNQNMIFYEDTLINFMLYKVAKSYYYLKNIGYFYIANKDSSTMGYYKNEIRMNKIFNSLFIFLKFIYEYTKNNQYEKDMGNQIITKELEMILSSKIYNKIHKNYYFYENIINMYLKNKFTSLPIKNKIKNIKDILKKNNEH